MKANHMPWILAVALVAAGCAHPPQTEMDAAKQALDGAQQAQAIDYASDSWNAAKDAEAKLDAELEAQQHRWAPVRSYAKARELAVQVKDSADRAAQDAVAAKEKTKTEAETLMAQAKDAYDKTHTALSTAPRGKGTEADLASLKSDTTSIEGTLQEMQRAYDAGDYLGAKTKAQAAIDAANRIQTEIQEAKARRRAA